MSRASFWRKRWIGSALVVLGLGFLWLLLVYAPMQVVHGERSPITRSPAEVGVAFEDIELVSADGMVRLAGWWMPAEAPRASLVFIHGGSSNRH